MSQIDMLINKIKDNKSSSSKYNKINGIDGLLWINLDSSKDRKKKMKKTIKKIDVTKIRISGVDGLNYNVIDNFIENKNDLKQVSNLKNTELALTLSHFKVFDTIKNLSGKYFMVCEDDISLENVKYFNLNLKDIIKNSPDFDILTLYKTKLNKLDNMYTDLNKYNKVEKYDHIWGSVAYIITKKFAKKLSSIIKYNSITNKFIINTDKEISQSDVFVFSLGKTFVYKYNFISTGISKSLIHLNDAKCHKNLHEKSIINQLKYILADFT